MSRGMDRPGGVGANSLDTQSRDVVDAVEGNEEFSLELVALFSGHVAPDLVDANSRDYQADRATFYRVDPCRGSRTPQLDQLLFTMVPMGEVADLVAEHRARITLLLDVTGIQNEVAGHILELLESAQADGTAIEAYTLQPIGQEMVPIWNLADFRVTHKRAGLVTGAEPADVVANHFTKLYTIFDQRVGIMPHLFPKIYNGDKLVFEGSGGWMPWLAQHAPPNDRDVVFLYEFLSTQPFERGSERLKDMGLAVGGRLLQIVRGLSDRLFDRVTKERQ